MDLHGDLADRYREFAAYAEDDSPCLADWARGVAEDPEVLDWLAGLPGTREQQPNLVFAAARWHGVPAPGRYAGLRDALLADGADGADGPLRSTLATRATQTNEVGRLATLVPALALVARREGAPLALVEVGASAGLCLYPDRWDYTWTTDAGPVRTDSGAAGRLTCTVEGAAPLPAEPPPVAWRAGLDLHPLDVTDEDHAAWLEVLVWPEQEERRQRLRTALAVARAEPPHVERGDLLRDLPDLVRRAARHGPVVVFHSAVTAYLAPRDRAVFEVAMRDLVAAGACHWVSNEAKDVHPAVTATGPAVPRDQATFVLGLDGRALAWTHGHGASLRWVGPERSEGSELTA